MGNLYIVATPIGNLEDITFRAVSTLRQVDLIFCEDTRVTRKLTANFDIETSAESLNARTENKKIDRVLEVLKDGRNVALVTDAGTPAVSDPGAQLVAKVREQLPEVKIQPIPGPSSLTAALSVAGLPVSEFLFLGFLPHKKGRETLFQEISESKRTVVIYESPHRLIKTLKKLSDILDSTYKVVVLRELTKYFEEIVGGSPEEVLLTFSERENIKGEIILMIGGRK
ncbi:MAG: 16S rRNA (cytidine(1402)-2'-O)-methyltransferase [Candidatus Campbellbacteria bacterium]|nr:16S rRNA (cytidine(1402)-2'-O)-methyltransferase [Candidatus Campbellbacteria bacterium]